MLQETIHTKNEKKKRNIDFANYATGHWILLENLAQQTHKFLSACKYSKMHKKTMPILKEVLPSWIGT